ncbi:MAG: transporter associated domain-containing protein [Rhodovibrio sp.]|nr:transporter associated domain-containing protein [Rhodovibrio sp.]
MPIRDLNRQFEWKLPDEEASTIAGLVLHEARRIPEIGQVFRLPRLPLRDPGPPAQPDHLPQGDPAGRQQRDEETAEAEA